MKTLLFLRKTLVPLVCLAAAALGAEGPQIFAIHGARIVPVSGPTIEKGTIVLRNGVIEAVGANVTPPADAWIIEGEGLTVYPGMVDALSTWGIPGANAAAAGAAAGGRRAGGQQTPGPNPAMVAALTTPAPVINGPEDRPSNSSYAKAADQIVASDRSIETGRDAGFTTAVTFPTTNIFAGKGVVFDLGGERAGQMVVNPSAGQYIIIRNTGGFGGSYPGSLMGVIAYIRQIYLDADHYKLANEIYNKHPQGLQRPAYDRTLEGVIASPRTLLPAARLVEVDRMIRLAHELKLNAVLYGGEEGWRAADLIAKAKMPVLVSLKWPVRPADANPADEDSLRTLEMRDKAPSTPAAFAKAGIKFAFYSDGVSQSRDLMRAVKRAIDAGLSQADAIRALTLSPAEIYGVSDRLGSIDKGKIANIVVTDGDLFQDKTKVKYVFVDGLKYEPAPEAPATRRGTDVSNEK
jgi:hypothetical protein